MYNDIQSFEFNGHSIPVVAHQGESWMTGESIGTALEYDFPRQRVNDIYRKHKDELGEYSVELKMSSTDGKQYMTRVYNEEGVMIITMLSRQPKAAEFRRWAVKVLKGFRHGQMPSAELPATLTPEQFEAARARLEAMQTALMDSQVMMPAAQYQRLTDPHIQVGRKTYLVTDLVGLLEEHGIPRELIIEITGLDRNTLRQHAWLARHRKKH